MLGWLFGSNNNPSKRYLIPGRLEDVLALIQVLAMAEYENRGESVLQKELVGKPLSADSWIELGKQHREFFRVSKSPSAPSAALIARYYSPSKAQGSSELKLDSWLIRGLLDAAIQIHMGQLQRKQILKAGWIGGASGAIFSAVIQLAIVAFRR